jgi:hypothetical protein
MSPILFSLTLSKFWRTHKPTGLALDGWYADDGILGAAVNTLKAAADAFLIHGPAVGLHLAPEKCEIITSDGLPPVGFSAYGKCLRTTKWSHLGVECGNIDAQEEPAAVIAEKVSRRIRLIGTLALRDPQACVSLLRLSGGFPRLVYFLRGLGCQPAWVDVDDATAEVVRLIVPHLTPLAKGQAQLPIRMGGAGLRCCNLHAPLAFGAAAKGAATILRCFIVGERCPSGPDPLALFNLRTSFLAHFPTTRDVFVTACQQEGTPQPWLQKKLSATLDKEFREYVTEDLSPYDFARWEAASGPGSSFWLSVPAGCERATKLSPHAFYVHFTRRLGLPICEPGTCALCLKSEADGNGDHTLCCGTSGAKTLVHNQVRNELFTIASVGLLRPRKEDHAFARSPAQRIDISLPFGPDGRKVLIDVAVTHALRTDHLPFPGRAAARYETVKFTEYGPVTDNTTQWLVPLVFDSFGNHGPASERLLRWIANAYAARIGNERLGRLQCLARLNGALFRALATPLLGQCAAARRE